MKTNHNNPKTIYMAEKGSENFKPIKVSKVEFTNSSKKLKQKPEGKSVFSMKIDKASGDALWKAQNQAIREKILLSAQRYTQ